MQLRRTTFKTIAAIGVLSLGYLGAYSSFSAPTPVSCKTALVKIFKNEGGFTLDRNDAGNWTGGKVGRGQLLGTKYGIAANTYGQWLLRHKRTIKGLTLSDAAQLYERDYWNTLRIPELKSQWLATMFLDTAVNCGTGVSAILITRTINVLNGLSEDFPVDPVLSSAEIAWINSYTESRWYGAEKDAARRHLFGSVFREMRARYYCAIVRHDRTKLRYLPVWIARVYE